METLQGKIIFTATRRCILGNDIASEERIKSVILDHFGVKFSDLITKSRLREVCFPRHVIMYFLVNHTQLPLRAIGKMFGERDHTSVIHANQVVKDIMDVDCDVADEIHSLSLKIFPLRGCTKIESKEILLGNYRVALQILQNMRKAQKDFEKLGGWSMKKNKKYWEEKADEYLYNLGGNPEINIPEE